MFTNNTVSHKIVFEAILLQTIYGVRIMTDVFISVITYIVACNGNYLLSKYNI